MDAMPETSHMIAVLEYAMDKSGVLPGPHPVQSLLGGFNRCRPPGRYLNALVWITRSVPSRMISVMEEPSGGLQPAEVTFGRFAFGGTFAILLIRTVGPT